MARRTKYSGLIHTNTTRTERVTGKGQQIFRGFECPNPPCEQFQFIDEADLNDSWSIECQTCGLVISAIGSQKLFDYTLWGKPKEDDRHEHLGEIPDSTINPDVPPGTVEIETGYFKIDHIKYVETAERFKYCLLCSKLKPVQQFHRHKSMSSGFQGECKLCKTLYNTIKNKTRLTDQHQEAANRRRMFGEITGSHRVDVNVIRTRFNVACFKCGLDLAPSSGNKENFDHTLPVSFLWPLTTDNATLLCSRCNGEKTNKWPSEFYTKDELKHLSIQTGIKFDLLAGDPHFNPTVVSNMTKPHKIRDILTRYAHYEHEVFRLRNRIQTADGLDIFSDAKINPQIIERANEAGGAMENE